MCFKNYEEKKWAFKMAIFIVETIPVKGESEKY